MKSQLFMAATLAGLLLLSWHTAFAADAPAAKPKISMAQAEKVALTTYPGQIIKKELEQEKGGSGLRYSFDIKNGKVVHEVGIDAVTGEVLENSLDNDND